MSWIFNKRTKAWECSSYSDLTPAVINNFAEHGQPWNPKNGSYQKNHQPNFGNITIVMPQSEVMTNGYGKDMTAEDFPIVQRFLKDRTLAVGTYSFDDLVKQGFAKANERRLAKNLYTNFSGPTEKYVHGSVGFALQKPTQFIVTRDRRQVQAVIGALDDNWDFNSSNVPNNLNSFVEWAVGPETNNLTGPIRINYTGTGKSSTAEEIVPQKTQPTPTPSPQPAGSGPTP